MTAEQIAQLQQTLDRIAETLATIAERLDKPSPGWRRMLDEFKGAVSRMPTSIRMRP